MKTALKKTYLDQWQNYHRGCFENDDAMNSCYPHLLSMRPNQEKRWKQSNLRVMIFGISPNGWDAERDLMSESPESAITYLMNKYEEFYFDGGNWKRGEAFWNYFYTIQEMIRLKVSADAEFAWNNVYKTDMKDHNFQINHFNVTLKEILIYAPDVIILMGKGIFNPFRWSILDDEMEWNPTPNNAGLTDLKRPVYSYIDGRSYSHLGERLKHIVMMDHANAHTNAGIKMKFVIEELEKLLKSRN
ncbi:MAG TPA: hypothetical protein VK826_12465 [Bacteroidia bacterium]|nr:hypothetical protein [Bacteroidia bacterium]